MATCSECDKSVYAKGLCSAHYQKARYHHQLPATPSRSCEYCGAAMTGGNAAARYCSRKCIDKARQQRDRKAARTVIGERHCLVCAAAIPDSLTLRAKCCSPECSVKWQNQQKAVRKHEDALAARAERPPCPRCGSSVPLKFKRGTVYCSKNCQQLAWNERTGYMRQYLYGVPLEQFEAMLAAQDGRCAICNSPDWPAPVNSGSPHVDHDHGCDQGHAANRACARCARGLLCGHCNNGIGQLGHDPARLRAAAEYLEAHMS